MTKKEAEEYIRAVHNKVDGVKYIKFAGIDLRVPDLETLKNDFKGLPPMSDYDHAKYIEAKKVLKGK